MITNHTEFSLLASKQFKECEDMYKIVDFLNKNLKKEGLVFGLTRKNELGVISIYRTNGSQK